MPRIGWPRDNLLNKEMRLLKWRASLTRIFLMEKREYFEHLIPSFTNLAVATVSHALSSKMKATSIDVKLEKIHEQLGIVNLFTSSCIHLF